MHRKFGEVWHVVFKICKQTYNTLGWKRAVMYRTVFYIAFKPKMFGLFVCLFGFVWHRTVSSVNLSLKNYGVERAL